MTTETWKQGGSTVRTLDFSYDTVDRLTALDDSDSLATDFQFAYDQRGQLVSERQLSGLIGTSVVFTRQYDARGNRSELAANFGGTLSGGSVSGGVDAFVNEYVYDEGNRLGSVTQTEQSGGHAVAPKHATLIYNRASQLTDLRRYSADSAGSPDLEIHSRREYDDAGRLVSITHGNQEISGSQTWDGTSTPPSSLGASGMLAAYRMDYDENHRLASMASYADGFETGFGYDDRDQLTSATSAAISGLSQPYGIPSSESYDFDENGNRKSSGGQSQSDPDTHNQLQSDGTFNYTYDDEGNTLTRTEIASGEVTEYEWDHRNRLARITERTSASGSIIQEIEYIYDAFDQRVGKRIDSDGNRTWDRDEAYVWTEGQTHLRLTDSDGEGTAETFHVASRYLYGDIVDHLLADEQFTDGTGPAADATTAGETLWALVDHLGSVRDLVANGGVIREHVVYDSFGNRLVEQDYDSSGNAISSSHAEAVDSLFGYTGRAWDKDAGLQYNRARWYDPATGRWLSNDPIGFAAGDSNLYRYVGNQPTTKTDPSGLQEKPTHPGHRRTPEEQEARDLIDRHLERYRRTFGIDPHAQGLLNRWLDGDGSPFEVNECDDLKGHEREYIDRLLQHPDLASVLADKIRNHINSLMQFPQPGTSHGSFGPELYVFPENSYGPSSLYGYLRGGSLSGNMQYDMRRRPGGGWTVNFSGTFVYEDDIDMNFAVGDDFFCRWTDPAGGGRDYHIKFTWEGAGQLEYGPNGELISESGYPFSTVPGYSNPPQVQGPRR